MAESASNNISSSGGFSNATAGRYPPDQTYGIFLCRGDIDASTCSNCVATPAKILAGDAPVNGLNVTEDPSGFFQLLNETMDDVLRRAPSSGSGKKVAAAEAEFVGSQRLYTLAECTPDLTASDCGTCLRSAIARLRPETPGGRYLLRAAT
ncbi:putative cysteine-rich repeat secretory protein 5 [Eucalyptus grandis]|uniref:putative cysteine-rich repeat secretory protein 5 n=1 Tax=Eucalyptus grandis TaxID=71139 RepID=UPI00192F0C4A|nr:putative cysteine-rich repeat secretory protein 5 [Eucalyptus grandis]